MTKDPRVYLAHILECADRIERYPGQDREAFLCDTMVQDAVIWNLRLSARQPKEFPSSSGWYILKFLGG